MADRETETEKLGAESRIDGDKNLNRALLFGAVLLLSHFLTIKPSDLDAGGMKISIEDPQIVRSAISLVFWFHLVNGILCHVEAAFLQPMNVDMRAKRAYLASVTAFPLIFLPEPMKRTRSEIKKTAKTWFRIYSTLKGTYLMVVAAFMLVSAAFAVIDTFRLVAALWSKV